MSPENLFKQVQLLRQKKPLIHNIANYVAMPTIANVLLALGASPLMAHEESELEEIIQISDALVLNIGTLDKQWIRSMQMAQQLAIKKSIPIILDPVGAGATTLRTQTAIELLQRGVQILRGNASEIIALTDHTKLSRGVDSSDASHSAIFSAAAIAKKYHCIVVISGETDFITDGVRNCAIKNGTFTFTKVTAMGCAVSAVVAAFSAITSDLFIGACQAMTLFSLAGEYAEKKSMGPGTFYTALLDGLDQLTKDDLKNMRIEMYAN